MNFSIGIYSCPMHPIHLVGLYTTRLPVFRWKARVYDWILVDSIGQPSNTQANLKTTNYWLPLLSLRVDLAPYWLISRNTITFHKYFWCLRFCEFHSKNLLFLTLNYCRYNIKPFSSGENCEISEVQYNLMFSFIVSFTIVELRFTERDY